MEDPEEKMNVSEPELGVYLDDALLVGHRMALATHLKAPEETPPFLLLLGVSAIP